MIDALIMFCLGMLIVIAMWKYAFQITWWQAARGIYLLAWCCIVYPGISSQIDLETGEITHDT
jgi:hypothetical protein